MECVDGPFRTLQRHLPTRSSRACGDERGTKAVKSVAVVGASGAVGEVMIRLLEERKFPVGSIKFLASERSAGKSVEFARRDVPDRAARRPRRSRGSTSSCRAPRRRSRASSARSPRRAGAVVVDNSSAFRMDPDVPLVVPEVNPHDVARHKGIIANPNCSTIQMVVALKPLHDAFRIRRVVVSTYQSVSGAGQKGMHELRSQTEAHVAGQDAPAPVASSPTRSRSTASPRSTTSCPTATPRKR